MSTELIDRNSDLRQLRDEGYAVQIKDGYLLLKDVPYVNASGKVCRGVLLSTLTLAGDVTQRPDSHTVWFAGETPCDKDGKEIEGIKHSSTNGQAMAGLKTSFMFSNKPADGYANYYEKMTRYADIISHPAAAIDEAATPKSGSVVTATDSQSVFNYLDTATSRAGVGETSARLRVGRIAIIGLGGTGSYALDLVAKTPVGELHLFDGDRFLQHNAFRSPGAASIEELRATLSKVEYLTHIYSKMRRGIIPHGEYVTEQNIELLREMDFVFICIDRNSPKKIIVDRLLEWGIPFIDVGMGLRLHEGSITGQVRTTLGTPEKHDHLGHRMSFVDDNDDAAYDSNIQIADLNALNAALAVVRWKKLFGFYLDRSQEHQSVYRVGDNISINEDQP
jgi:hypothetical protein